MECIEYINTQTRQRGLYMIGNHLAILCQYHKSASITGTDKLIPHSLDAVTSDLIIQDLAIARPFAELAIYILYPDNATIQRQYQSYLFINNKRLFDTQQLSDLLKRYTNPIFDVGLGVADWRHISAAFRRKICPAMDQLVEEDDSQESIPALQSGHTRQTENLFYGITPEALAGFAEDVLPLFLDASGHWQLACKIVPGGYLLHYMDAKAMHFATLAATKKIKATYATPVTTIEQVMERVIIAIDAKLEKQSRDILDRIDQKIEEVITTRFIDLFESKLNGAFDKIAQRFTAGML